MINRVINYIKQHHMISEHDHVIAGVSGGADSVCLFLLLEELREKLGFTLSVAHVEHGIRGEESLRDAEFVKELAGQYHVDVTCYSFFVPGLAKEQRISIEEAARKVRYEAFEQAALKAQEKYHADYGQIKIAVAHHMEDLAETVVFHLCRGSGIDGICGISPRRGRIIRPLLCVSREEIEEYLKKRGQNFCTDSTNGNRDYSRNFIRHEILPRLKEVNRQSISHIADASRELWDISCYLKNETESAFSKVVGEEREGVISCDTEELEKYPDVIRKRVLKKVLETAAKSSRDITREHVELILDLCRGQVGRKASLPYHLLAEKTYTKIRIRPEENEGKKRGARVFGELQENQAAREMGEEIIVPGGRICCRIWENKKKNINFPKKKYTKWLDYDKIKNGLLFRTRESGDFLVIDEMGHKKKLKDYFIHEKVPRDYRDQVVLAADGSHILWVIGYRISGEYKVTENTGRILEICWMEEQDE